MSNNNAHSYTRALACSAMSAVLCAGKFAGVSSGTATGGTCGYALSPPRHEVMQVNGFWKD